MHIKTASELRTLASKVVSSECYSSGGLKFMHSVNAIKQKFIDVT